MSNQTLDRGHRADADEAPTRGSALFAVRMLSWVVIGSVALVLVVGVLAPRIAGARPYAILTGSMQPDLPPGTLVVVKPAAAQDIAIGSVITYQIQSGQPTVVTHRVVSQGIDGNGDFVYWTKGDANSAVDAAPVRPVQVMGKLWYSVPYLGYASELLSKTQHSIVLYGLVALLLGYAVWMFADSARERRRTAAS